MLHLWCLPMLGKEIGEPLQFTLLEFMDAAIEKGAKLKQIKTVKAKEMGKIVLNPVSTPMVSDVNSLLENG